MFWESVLLFGGLVFFFIFLSGSDFMKAQGCRIPKRIFLCFLLGKYNGNQVALSLKH